MTKIRSVKGCKTARQFSKAVRSQGGWSEAGGRHPKFCHPEGGKIPYTSHGNKDMGKGSSRGLVGMLMGIGFLVFMCIIPLLILMLA